MLKHKSMPPWLLYSLYFLAVTVFFLYLLFPAETVKRVVDSIGSRLDPGLRTTVQRVRPALPACILLSDIRLIYDGQLLLKTDRAKVTPRLTSFLKGKRGFRLHAVVSEGTLDGKVEIDAGLPSGRLHISSLNLAKVPALSRLTLKPSGRLWGNFDFRPQKGKAKGIGSVRIDGLKVRLKALAAAVPDLAFNAVTSKLSLDGNQVHVTDGKARGRQADATIDGKLTVSRPLRKSAIDFSVTVHGHTELIAALRKNPVLRMVSGSLAKKAGLAIRIGGFLEDPQLSLK